MSEPLVLVEADGPVLVVTINRPEKKNAANAEVLCRLYDAWVRLDTDDDLRVAILTGKGDTFCAGMDLAEIGRLRQGVVDNEWLQRFKDQPEVILAGRRINNSVAPFIAQKMAKLLIENDIPVKRSRVGILGLTFKEDVNDLRNSKVPDILKELAQFGIDAVIHDPHADEAEAKHEYGLKLTKWEEIRNLDGLIIAVNHKVYKDMGAEKLLSLVRHGGVVVDAKSMMKPADMERGIKYWSL